ncbi:MAG: hypothetical protein Kow00121_23980 [Elainellaceae cyanobacterium]
MAVVSSSDGEAVALALPLLEVAPGVKLFSLLVLVSPEGEVAVALLLLPAPALVTKEIALDWLEL